MENIRYHEVKPTNDKSSYTAEDLIDFNFEASGRKLVKNSVEISGKVSFFINDASVSGNLVKPDLANVAGEVLMNANCGAHAFFENMSVSSNKLGSIEAINVSYPRFVSMSNVLTKGEQDKNNVEDILEWRTADTHASTNFTYPYVQGADNTNKVSETNYFSIKPQVAINRMQDHVSFDSLGFVRLSCNLSSNNKAVKSTLVATPPAVVNSVEYKIEDIKLRFQTIPDDGMKKQVLGQKVVGIKSTINSTLASIVSNVPSKSANGVMISFQTLTNENSLTADGQRLEKINLDSLQFFFNNANTYLNYKLEDLSEVVLRGLKSISPNNDKGSNDIVQSKIAGLENFILGTDFDGSIDLSSNSVEVEIQSDITNAINVYLYFNTIFSLEG